MTGGDRYINLAGQCFAQTLPQNTIAPVCRGDEFIVLFYGYDRRDEIRQVLNRLSECNKRAHGASAERRHHAHQHFRRYRVVSGERQRSGYAQKYADFAMYQVKHEAKGAMVNLISVPIIRRSTQHSCAGNFCRCCVREAQTTISADFLGAYRQSGGV